MAHQADPKVFKNAVAIKDGLTKKQAKAISALYVDWAGQIQALADQYAKKQAPSYGLESLYQQQLKKQVTEMSKRVANGVYSEMNANLYTVADAVVADSASWLKGAGLSDDALDAAFSGIQQSTVNALLTGSVYGKPGTWSLSRSIWGDNEDTLKKLYQIVAQGSVMQMPTGKIAEALSTFVNPSKKFEWSGPDGYPPIYAKKVDYSSQRLARTLLQHCYQETFVATCKKNPLVTKIRYVANGSRVCDICKARDGKEYAVTKVPLDHPNGMCVLEPVMDTKQYDKLVDWAKGDLPEKDQKWWDGKMAGYGYDVNSVKSARLAQGAAQPGYVKASDLNKKLKELGSSINKAKAKDKLVNQLSKYDGDKLSILKSFATLDENLGVKYDSYQEALELISPKGKSIMDSFDNCSTMLEKLLFGNVPDGFDDYSESAINALVKAYKKVMGKDTANNYILFSERRELSNRLIELMFTNDVDELKAMGLPIDHFTSAKKVFKDFYGFDVDDVVALGKAKGKAADAAGFVDDVLSNAKSIYEAAARATEKAEAVKALKDAKAGVKSQVEDVFDKLKKSFGEFSGKTYSQEKLTLEQLKRGEKAVFDQIGDKQVNTMVTYTGSKYHDINAWLRSDFAGDVKAAKNYNVSTQLANDVNKLKEAMGKVKTTERMVLRRGTDTGDLAGLFMKGSFSDNNRQLWGKTAEELNQAFAGKVGEYKGLTSTSSVYGKGFGGDVEIIFDAPAGTHGMSVLTKSQYGDSEGEFLLNIGTKVRCLKIERSDGHMGSKIRVFVEILTD